MLERGFIYSLTVMMGGEYNFGDDGKHLGDLWIRALWGESPCA